jgi:hypothetical protein
MMIQIEGKNLRPVVDALKLRTADFLQEWCDDFDPAADGEPVITSIKVTKDPRMGEK